MPTPIPHQNYLLPTPKFPHDLILNRLRSHIVPRPEHNQILHPPHNPPIPLSIYFALIPGLKPSATQHLRSLLLTLPISPKNVRSSDNNFLVRAEPHLHALNRGPHASRLHVSRIIHCANR